MVFASIVFLSVFLPVVFLVHLVVRPIRVRNLWLIAASLLFYSYGEPVYVLLMLVWRFLVVVATVVVSLMVFG